MTIEVEVLIHDHKKAINTIDGLEFHIVPGLLAQLRDAVFGGMESTGGSAPGSRLPISAAALDLLTAVDHEIAEAWALAFRRPPGIDRSERLLAEWAAFITPGAIVTVAGRGIYAEALVDKWTRQIEDFFDPPRLSEIQADCFVCNARYVYAKVDGQDVRSAALRFHRSRETGETLDARCMSCGATWLPHQFDFLAESIGIDVKRKRDEHEAAIEAKA